jgi:signal transduction histidine kinase
MADGQPFDENFTLWMTLAVLAMIILSVLVIIIFRVAFSRVMEERKKMLESEINHRQELLVNSIQIQERERKRISEDLHDELTSKLNVLKINLYELKQKHPELYNKTGPILDDVINISRDISHDLYPPLLVKVGLIACLEELLAGIQNKVETDVFYTGNPESLSSDQKLQLMRIYQELIQNMLKHSKASKLSICLRVSDHSISSSIVDNGQGFDSSQKNVGLGLNSIKSRVQILGGSHKLKSQNGHGVRHTFFIPIQHENA